MDNDNVKVISDCEITKRSPAKEKKYNLVYKTTNLKNGKTYIGVHCTNRMEDGYIGNGIYRQRDALVKSKTQPFHVAVRKHGYENFKREILYEFGSLELAFWWEHYLVDEEFINRHDNYNAVVGGSCKVFGRNHSKETKNKMSLTRVGRKMSETHKRNISIGNKGKRLGMKASIETKAKMSKNRTGKKNIFWKPLTEKTKAKLSKKVECITTGEIFKSLRSASDETGCFASAVCNCLKGRSKWTRRSEDGTKLTWRYEDSIK